MYQPPKHGTVANVVPAGDFQQIKAQLEDTQESLAAAFARIEVFRLREKLLLAELAKVRVGGQPTAAAEAEAEGANGVAAVAAAGTASAAGHSTGTADVHQQQSCGQSDSTPPQQQQEQQQQQQQQEQQPDWPLPCYVTEVEGHLPVMLISSGGRKVRGAMAQLPHAYQGGREQKHALLYR
jgi:hypothetical protein